MLCNIRFAASSQSSRANSFLLSLACRMQSSTCACAACISSLIICLLHNWSYGSELNRQPLPYQGSTPPLCYRSKLGANDQIRTDDVCVPAYKAGAIVHYATLALSSRSTFAAG